MKVLSVIIPAYNTELYLERCLDSLLYSKSIIRYLDIIVVDDGSSDGTAELADKYTKMYPESVSVLKKENGGHGSAVNAGVKAAIGKYVRIVDSDDWVDIDNFSEYIKRLKAEKADIVVTDVRRQQLYDESSLNFEFEDEPKGLIGIESAADKVLEDNFFFEFSMHSMTVKLERLLSVWGDGLLEKTFYVDQQFVAKVFMCAKTYVEYNFNIYMYFIGRPEQSMGDGFFKHINDHERVLKWLLKTTKDKNLPKYYKKIVSRQIVLMLGTHYKAYANQVRLPKNKKKEIKSFDKYLRKNYSNYYYKSEAPMVFEQIRSVFSNTLLNKLVRYYRGSKV